MHTRKKCNGKENKACVVKMSVGVKKTLPAGFVTYLSTVNTI